MTKHSVGNKRFRGVIEENLVRYVNAKQKQEKSKIVSEIVDTIRRNAGIGGFVKKVRGEIFVSGSSQAFKRIVKSLVNVRVVFYSFLIRIFSLEGGSKLAISLPVTRLGRLFAMASRLCARSSSNRLASMLSNMLV